MNGDKKYPKFLINEDFLVYGSVFISVLFVLVVIFFNNIPITDFEVFIDTYLIKGNGVYSHIYSFQSEVISNLSMIIAPLFAIYTVLTSKFTYLSEREMIDSGITIEKSNKNHTEKTSLHHIITASCSNIYIFDIHR